MVLPIVAPSIPVLGPLIAISQARSQPRVAPEEVADPAPAGGYLPRVRSFVQEEISPLLEGTPFAIVDRGEPEDEEFDEDLEEEDFDEGEDE